MDHSEMSSEAPDGRRRTSIAGVSQESVHKPVMGYLAPGAAPYASLVKGWWAKCLTALSPDLTVTETYSFGFAPAVIGSIRLSEPWEEA